MDSCTSYMANESDDWIVKLVAEGRYFGSKYGPVMRKWILLSGALTSVDQLFDVYLWNYRQLTHGILMFDSGIVDGTTDNGTGMADRITVNAYAMNYVSNGVNLVEFLEAFCNAAKKDGYAEAQVFIDDLRREYDGNFNYALAHTLRNHAQHGQLIVSLCPDDNDRQHAGFDLYQLRNPIFFTNKKLFEKRIDIYQKIIESVCSGSVKLSFYCEVTAIHESICQLTSNFIDAVSRYYEDCSGEIEETYKLLPEYVIRDGGGGVFSIFIDDQTDDSEAHLLIGDPKEMLDSFQTLRKRVLEELQLATQEYEEMRKHLKPLNR